LGAVAKVLTMCGFFGNLDASHWHDRGSFLTLWGAESEIYQIVQKLALKIIAVLSLQEMA
jgi:hypothetical protein